MGRRGPVPRPDSLNTAQKRNTFHRKTSLPDVDPAAVTVPAPVACDAAALAYWNDLAPLLIQQKRLRPESAVTFGLLCSIYADEQRLRAKIDEEGWTLETAKGPVHNPAASQLHRVRTQYIALAREFGLTAAAEARIPVEASDGEENTNPLQAFGITG